MKLALFLKYKTQLLGMLLGAIAGYLYYIFVGCASGTCMIASNPFVAIPYFSFIGYLMGGLFKKSK
jgi:xanthine/uracil permease